MVLYASDFDLSKYLKSGDLGDVGTEKRLKIKTVTKETHVGEREETKACLWFTTTDKGLLLNKTNRQVLWDAFGNDMSLWAGKVIVVFVAMTEFRGKMGPGLRVRIPPPKDDYRAPAPKKPPPKPQVEEEPDDFDEAENLDDER